jgi:hypothetical protein
MPGVGGLHRLQLTHRTGTSGQSQQTRLAFENALKFVDIATGPKEVQDDPGSTAPDRVAIGMPSNGVIPIDVSTERPSRTAVTDAPPPR